MSFFFNDTATTEIYTLSLHDALPISAPTSSAFSSSACRTATTAISAWPICRRTSGTRRSEEHTSELQSRLHLVCRLLLEKKKKNTNSYHIIIHTIPTHSDSSSSLFVY